MSRVEIELTARGAGSTGTVKIDGVQVPGVFGVTLVANATEIPPILRLEFRPREVVVTGDVIVRQPDVPTTEVAGFIEKGRGHG